MGSAGNRKAPGSTTTRGQHWERVYETRSAESVSWFQRTPEVSLRLVDAAGLAPDAAIIDVGGGASTLVDGLAAAGYQDLTVLDISTTALRISRSRLGQPLGQIEWIESDVLGFEPRRAYDLWHDRALFHFMTGERQQQAYRDVMRRSLAPQAQAIIATFAMDGPERCSGLPVRRYDAERLCATLGDDFGLVAEERESHLTPGGEMQQFHYFLLRRR